MPLDYMALLKEAQKDEKYLALLLKIRQAEKRLDEQEKSMTDAQRDAMWEFFDLSEEMNLRLLEIASQKTGE